ncbi:MAG: DNA-processing protein DprA [Pseudomonadota bacterium]
MTSFQKIPTTAVPKTTQAKIDWLCLTRSRRVGPATFIRLLNEYGDATRALAALPEIARNSGAKNYEPYKLASAKSEFERGLYAGYTPLFLGMRNYPTLLAEAPDAPPFLWANGDVDLGQRSNIGLVGARNASALGQRLTKSIASELGEIGYVVTSGLARGIDTAAHLAALGGGTIAVFAGGIDKVYPQENAKLSVEIGKKGLILSEQPLGLVPQARHFPQRNRIIAGLVQALCVIEGATRSGSLITARAAADIGRDVMAVPGNPMDPRAAGCNMLIKEGATLVRNAGDIHEAVETPKPNPKPKQPDQPKLPLERHAQAVDRKILSILSTSAISEDILIRDTGLSAEIVSRELAMMELDGRVIRQAGGMLALAS